ncbi:hypothetical protein PsYK624_023200 [Phanerochaete sordida]|uniref:F-box domain-containing protein n=1 Tax=Phanerochaete sordida TaxID=48140 RepID=A0A9P3G1L3_9APHY|nr:hypothetical protein PsYK624_023200 [Phanerochaete sordida]
MPSTRSVWYNLPELVFLVIFEQATRDTIKEDGLPFALLVSHVCKGWRTIVALSPSVWCAIPIHPARPGLLEYFMERVGVALPLDICFHIKDRRTDVRPVLALGMSQPERIRELYLCGQDGTAVFLFISQIRYMNLPSLAHFEISLPKSTNPRNLGPLPDILNYRPPATLSSVALEGVSFHFQSAMLKGLTRLTLSCLPRTFAAPSYVAFRDLLLSSPALEYLKLDHVFPLLTQEIDYGEITLPSLHALALVMSHDRSYVSDFFAILSAPNIRTFSFETSWPVTAAGFDDALRILRASFERLHTLRLALLTPYLLDDRGVTPSLFAAFPELRALTLTAHSDRVVLHYLEPWIVATIEGSVIWPELELLTVRSPFGDLEAEGAESCVDESLELLADLREAASLPFDVWQEHVVPQPLKL